MRNKKQLESPPTFEKVWALLQESIKETKEMKRQSDKEIREMKKQSDKEMKEMRRESKELNKRLESMYEEARRERKEMNRHLGGIDNSNGDMAEAYFYNAFKANRTFVQERFDSVDWRWRRTNGIIEAEFDIILFNGKSVVIIEVKYNANPSNIRVRDVVSRVEVFKTWQLYTILHKKLVFV